MKITEKVLDEYQKLIRHNDSWIYRFDIKGIPTRVLIQPYGKDYFLFTLQQVDRMKVIWENEIVLGLIFGTDELEELFLSVTRGEHL